MYNVHFRVKKFVDNKFALKSDLSNDVSKDGDSTINGSLTINNCDNDTLKLLNENITETTEKMKIILGKSENDEKANVINFLNLGGLMISN